MINQYVLTREDASKGCLHIKNLKKVGLPISDWEIANLASDIYEEDHNRPVVFLMEIIEGG